MGAVAIIVAAGRGSRAGEGLPKQFRDLGGMPVLARTLRAFLAHEGVDTVLCAIHPDDRELYEQAVSGLEGDLARKLLPPVNGGAMRQDSVRMAVASLPSNDDDARVCLVHDAARPFVSAELISRSIAAGTAHEAAVPGVSVTDTVRRIAPAGEAGETLERAHLRAVQTPQAFRLSSLRRAHEAAVETGRHDFTDDGHLLEWAGVAVHVFEGDPVNTKMTRPEDFAEGERRLGSRAAVPMIVRLGTGFDVHAFGPGDHVWLGGLRVPHEVGVLAHSDGDVVLHALTDALLGAIADGDIGTHFPPSDPQWKGASSDRFLAFAAALVRSRGGLIDHLDVTVLCERPRIGEHRAAMRERIAAIADVPLSAVSIKATTTERLGFTGRAEGLAAQAAATVRLPEGA